MKKSNNISTSLFVLPFLVLILVFISPFPCAYSCVHVVAVLAVLLLMFLLVCIMCVTLRLFPVKKSYQKSLVVKVLIAVTVHAC